MTNPAHPAEQILAAFIDAGEWFDFDKKYRYLCIDGTIELTDQQTEYLTTLPPSGGTSPTGTTTSSTDQEGTT